MGTSRMNTFFFDGEFNFMLSCLQLKVFAEDFEHEREDRTMAESARDAAKKEVESLARQNHSLSSQIKHLQKQVRKS